MNDFLKILLGTIINEEDWQVIRNEEDKRISRVIVRRVLKTRP